MRPNNLPSQAPAGDNDENPAALERRTNSKEPRKREIDGEDADEIAGHA